MWFLHVYRRTSGVGSRFYYLTVCSIGNLKPIGALVSGPIDVNEIPSDRSNVHEVMRDILSHYAEISITVSVGDRFSGE